MSDGGWLEMENFLANLHLKENTETTLRVESWLRRHWDHKPGPQVIHKWDRTMQGFCPKCQERIDLRAPLPD